MRTNLRAALVAALLTGAGAAAMQLSSAVPNVSGPPVSGVPSMHIFGIALG